jgi:hypothetical protein
MLQPIDRHAIRQLGHRGEVAERQFIRLGQRRATWSSIDLFKTATAPRRRLTL